MTANRTRRVRRDVVPIEGELIVRLIVRAHGDSARARSACAWRSPPPTSERCRRSRQQPTGQRRRRLVSITAHGPQPRSECAYVASRVGSTAALRGDVRRSRRDTFATQRSCREMQPSVPASERVGIALSSATWRWRKTQPHA
jgi:hypothetical protein